ncbi:MAG: alpha/beta hydrolase family protein [Prevotella sp.]|nr:alpha/beta hydrolase family protein [Prevotellaceae bacterium]MDY5249497.1 alpha/beta hydrolase family protein [Prevotella sp.]
MKTGNKIIVLILAALLPMGTSAQKKSKLQKRDRYEFSFDLPTYVEQLKTELTYPLAWGNSKTHNFSKWKRQAKAKVLECMMASPRQADSYSMNIISQEQREGYKAMKIEFNVNAYSRIRAYILVPEGDGPFPAINLLHDHGGHLFIGKEKMIRPIDENAEVTDDARMWSERLYDGQYMGDYLASKGYVVFSADAPMWGERGREEGVDRSKYDIIAGNMMMLGRDLSAFMTYDDISGTHFLSTLPYVDSSRIGCAGCSMGGYRAWMLSALSDDIKVGASICWMTTTMVQMSVKDKKKEYGGFANCIPGLRQYLDYPHIASLACPKPMLFINGTQDHLFPVDGTREAFSIMQETWKSQNAADKISTELWDIPHSCGKSVQQRVLEFFQQHL